jgi:hypothetical protein
MRSAHKIHRVTTPSSLASMCMCHLIVCLHRIPKAADINTTVQSIKKRCYHRRIQTGGIPPISITSKHRLHPHSPFLHEPLTRRLIRRLCSVPIHPTQRRSNSLHIMGEAVFRRVHHILLPLRPRRRVTVLSMFLWTQSMPRSRETKAPATRPMTTASFSSNVVIFVGVLFFKLLSSMISVLSLFQIFVEISTVNRPSFVNNWAAGDRLSAVVGVNTSIKYSYPLIRVFPLFSSS